MYKPGGIGRPCDTISMPILRRGSRAPPEFWTGCSPSLPRVICVKVSGVIDSACLTVGSNHVDDIAPRPFEPGAPARRAIYILDARYRSQLLCFRLRMRKHVPTLDFPDSHRGGFIFSVTRSRRPRAVSYDID